jgi:hypothetical protein
VQKPGRGKGFFSLRPPQQSVAGLHVTQEACKKRKRLSKVESIRETERQREKRKNDVWRLGGIFGGRDLFVSPFSFAFSLTPPSLFLSLSLFLSPLSSIDALFSSPGAEEQ